MASVTITFGVDGLNVFDRDLERNRKFFNNERDFDLPVRRSQGDNPLLPPSGTVSK